MPRCTECAQNVHREVTITKLLLYLAFIAVISCFHWLPTNVAVVNKAVLALSVKLPQHCHGRVFSSSQRWKFVMPLTSKSQKRISAIHYITAHRRIWITRFWRLATIESNHKEDLENSNFRFPEFRCLMRGLPWAKPLRYSHYILYQLSGLGKQHKSEGQHTSLCFSIVL